MARNYIRTVKDLEDYYYGMNIAKADDPVLSTTAGVYKFISVII